MPERNDDYEWRACYHGYDIADELTFLDEYSPTGEQRGWKDIDHQRLVYFILVHRKPHLCDHLLEVSPDTRPIFFRRRRREISVETGEQITDTNTVTILGMQRTVRGVNVAMYAAFFWDGSVKVTNDPDLF